MFYHHFYIDYSQNTEKSQEKSSFFSIISNICSQLRTCVDVRLSRLCGDFKHTERFSPHFYFFRLMP